jgi:hypothetical protein
MQNPSRQKFKLQQHVLALLQAILVDPGWISRTIAAMRGDTHPFWYVTREPFFVRIYIDRQRMAFSTTKRGATFKATVQRVMGQEIRQLLSKTH